MTLRTVLVLVLIDAINGAQLMNCPLPAIKFAKVLGLRPADSNHPLLLYRDDRNRPITARCLEKCRSMADCRSFVIHHNVTTCYWFRSTVQGVQELDNVVDLDASWFIKTCLQSTNCSSLWAFEVVPGATLVGNDTKTLPDTLTRTECQQYCLDENEFRCRAAKFRIRPSKYGPNDVTRGTCVLSDADRHIVPNAYRASSYDDEYFENQCSDTGDEDFCFEEYDNATLRHSDLFFESRTKDGCQQLCQQIQDFHCRGYSVVHNNCYLHSEDRKVHGPKLLQDTPSGKYFERVRCVNISISCSETYMTVRYTPNTSFMGRMYMEGYSEQPQCYAMGRGGNVVVLRLPVLSDQCGIIKATTPDDNRTLMAGTMVLQYNPLVQTQGDRLIRVGCIYGNDSKVLVGTGISITSAPNKGSALVNFTSTANSPMVEMRILDLNSQEEASSTQIGQELQLVIEVKPMEGGGGKLESLDIWAGHLVAMTEKSEESILLLDERGCPTNLNIFPQLTKVATNESRKLIGTFQAFKFSSSPIVRFSVIVQFCPGNCPEVDCNHAVSLGRRKRDIQTQSLETVHGTKIVNVNRSDFDKVNGAPKLPLEFVMIVRDPVANSDRLVLGDGKILVAGYDYITNEVCLDYSLFVGLIVTWILVQIIFIVCGIVLVRRYKKYYEHESATQSMEQLHKNFGLGFSNLDNRRVHWADNGDYT